jgi:hypothetical protein
MIGVEQVLVAIDPAQMGRRVRRQVVDASLIHDQSTVCERII